ncbi:MAG: hypothetical protein AAF591_08655 [Verrucomicrobiota bacterium]
MVPLAPLRLPACESEKQGDGPSPFDLPAEELAEEPKDSYLVDERPKSPNVESLVDPDDPSPNPNDEPAIRDLFQRWSGTTIPKHATQIQYRQEPKPRIGETRHHLSFKLTAEEAAVFLSALVADENERFMSIGKLDKYGVDKVEERLPPHLNLSFSPDNTYWINFQPRWARDDALYALVDIKSGHVYAHRWDD